MKDIYLFLKLSIVQMFRESYEIQRKERRIVVLLRCTLAVSQQKDWRAYECACSLKLFRLLWGYLEIWYVRWRRTAANGG